MNLADPWGAAEFVALDLEGSGAQDRDREAILEIATVPVTGGQPDPAAAYSTLINPGRRIRRGPWISPGLTSDVLAGAPSPGIVGPELARRIDGKIMVGHNVSVDWRLLHRRYPDIAPAGLVDTLKLARRLRPGAKNGLGAVAEALRLTGRIGQLASGSQPHRALWDTTATAVLLPTLVHLLWPEGATLGDVLAVAALDAPDVPGAAFDRADVASSEKLAAAGRLF